MKKTVSLLVISAFLFNTSFIYAENENLNKKINENRQEQNNILKQINDLNEKIADIEKNILKSNEEIEALDIEIKNTQEEIKNLENNIKANEDALGERLKVINNNYSMGYLKVILSSTSLSDFFNNIYIVKQVVAQDKKMLKELDDNKIEIEKKENELEDKKNKQEENRKALQQDNESLLADKSELEELKRELEKEEEELEAKLEEIAMQNSIEVPEGAIISSGSWPVPGRTRISSPYGYRIHPILNTKKLHKGIDIPAPKGTPAVAIDNGTVIFSGVQSGYGNTLMIKHDDGKVTLYAHNDKLLASVGERVKKGQVVTKIGSTGRSTGPHLHFEVRINGKTTDPMKYIS